MAETRRPVATLMITVEYDHIPDNRVLEGVLDDLNGEGTVKTAMLEVHAPVTRDLLKEF